MVGAGLAGLSAAVRAGRARRARSTLLEAAARPAGAAARIFDATLGMTIDNGNHCVLSGNHAAHDYLRAIGAVGPTGRAEQAAFDFCDVASGARWTLRPNAGPDPWWVFAKARRVPGHAAADYLALAALAARRRAAGGCARWSLPRARSGSG